MSSGSSSARSRYLGGADGRVEPSKIAEASVDESFGYADFDEDDDDMPFPHDDDDYDGHAYGSGSVASSYELSDLAQREAELRRLNDQLDQKKKQIVQAADAVMKETENRLAQSIESLRSQLPLNPSKTPSSSSRPASAVVNNNNPSSLSARSARPASASINRPAVAPPAPSSSSRPVSAVPQKVSARGPQPSPRVAMNSSASYDSSQMHSDDEEPHQHLSMASPHKRPQSSSHAAAPASARSAEMNMSASMSAQDSDIDAAAAQMGVEGAMRFYKARSKALEEELKQLVTELKEKEARVIALQASTKDTSEERSKMQKAYIALEQRVEKQKKVLDDSHSKNDVLEQQLSQLRKELDTVQRAQRQAESEQQTKDVRLQRALEEVERYKLLLKEAKDHGKGAVESTRKNYDVLVNENRRLQKFNNDLVAAFKKQMQLISILKKQKMHVEAAKLLNFTEEEFTRTLELGERM